MEQFSIISLYQQNIHQICGFFFSVLVMLTTAYTATALMLRTRDKDIWKP